MHNIKPAFRYVSIVVAALFVLSGFGMLLSGARADKKDSDFDGLSDDYEEAIGTDPNNPDTDADGIHDADDPTPKGGMFNTEEVWNTWKIDAELEIPVIKEGEVFACSFDVQRLRQDGREETPAVADGTVYIYKTRSYSTLERVSRSDIRIRNGVYRLNHTATEPAKYYFILGINASRITLGKHATTYELSRLAREMKIGYVKGAAYPPLFTTVHAVYPTLLPGHRAQYSIRRYAYGPANRTRDFLSRFVNFYYPGSVLEDLYVPEGGKAYLHLFKGGLINKTTVEVPTEALSYNVTLLSEGRYNMAVTAYDREIAWDYAYSKKYPYSTGYVSVINSTVRWIDVGGASPSVFDNITISLHKYSITTTMNESDFTKWYSKGGLRGIATDHPGHVRPYKTDVWLSLFYYVYDRSSYGMLARTMFDRKLSLKGDAATGYELDLPGRYLAAASFSPDKPHHPGGTFELYERWGYRVSHHYGTLRYFHCDTDVRINAFQSDNVYFSNSGAKVSVTGVKGEGDMAGWRIATYLDGNYRGTEIFEDSSLSVDLGKLGKGTHSFRAITLYSDDTRTVVEELGVKNFPYNWIGQASFQVKDLLIYVDTPSSFVRGHEGELSAVVYGAGLAPVENAEVDIHMDSRYLQRIKVGSGRTGKDGGGRISFMPPNANYYELQVTATKKGLTATVSTYIWIRSEGYSGYIHTNKPVYLPGNTIHGQLALYDVDNAVPLRGRVEVRLTYQGNGKDIIRVRRTLDEFGKAEVEFPISKDAPWGGYRIGVYRNGDHLINRYVEVTYYETPDTRIVFDEDLSLRTGDVEIPVEVEYMFGAPVHQGTVHYRIKGFENRYEHPFYPYRDGIGADVEWFPGYYRWSEPTPVFSKELDVTVENGWANVSLNIPEGVRRLETEATFSDDYDHECEGSVTYYVGEAPEPGLKTGIDISPDKEKFTAVDDPIFHIRTYNYKEVEEGEGVGTETLGNVSTAVLVNVTSYDAHGNRGDEALFNITTDGRGKAEIDLNEAGVDTFNLSAEGRYYFRLSVSVIGDNTPPASNEKGFFVHSVVYDIETPAGGISPGANVSVALNARSLVPTVEAKYNYTLTVFKRERYYGYYHYGYRSLYEGSPIFATMGSASGEVEIKWRVPEHLQAGRYVVEVRFENGDYDETLEHRIEVFDRAPLKMELTPSRDKYYPGDVIDVQVRLSDPFKGYLHLSTSAGCSVLTGSRYVNGRNALFSFKTEDWHHALNAKVFLIDDEARIVSSRVTVEYGPGPLLIIAEMNRTDYEPGDKARLTVRALHTDGTPAAGAWVALSVADASVFEIFSDRSAEGYYEELATPYEFDRQYRRLLNWNSDTWYPEALPARTVGYWPNVIPYYQGGQQGGYDGDSDGMANDEAGGAPEAEAPGDAKLREDLRAELDSTDVREWFTDTALWNTTGITGEDGTFSINLTLPDNICKWRIRATAGTAGLIGGEGVAHFNVSKDFFIEPKLPYKMTQDDEIEFKVLIYNFHDEKIEAELGISAGEWLKVFGKPQVKVNVKANSIAEHVYRVKIFGAMTNNLTLIASDLRDNTDAVREEVFVTPNGALRTGHDTGVADPKAEETVTFSEYLINGTQRAVLRLAPGYQGLLKMGYSMLSGYPYDCTEQITSRLIPSVLFREYLKEIGRLNWRTDRHLKRRIYREAQSLLAKQHNDGGWGWWKGDKSDLWMSGWVLLGLTTMKESGLFVDQGAIAACQRYLLDEMVEGGAGEQGKAAGAGGYWQSSDPDDMNDAALTAFLYYSLSRSGANLPGEVEDALDDLAEGGELTSYGSAFRGLGLLERGQPVDGLLGDLSSEKVGSHFQSGQALGGHVETTGWVLYLLAKDNSDKALIRELLEWLNSRRLSTGDWGATTATVASMYAILEALKSAQPVDMDVTVSVNGEEVASEHVDEDYQRPFRNKLDALDITEYLRIDRKNVVTVSKKGKGDLFYELTTVEYLRKDVKVNFSTELAAEVASPMSFEVVADPVNTPDIRVVGLNVRAFEHGGLVYLNTSAEWGGKDDSPVVFTFNYLPNETGKHAISPVIVSYKLTAGQRESALITKYYGPVEVEVLETPMRRGGGRGISDAPVSLEKTADAFAARTGEEIEITLKVWAGSEGDLSEGAAIRDYLSSAFVPTDGSGVGWKNDHMEFRIDGTRNYQEFTYTVVCKEEYGGDLGTAVVWDEGSVLGSSGGPSVTVSSDPYFIQRSYSAVEGKVFQPIDVGIKAWSATPGKYLAVEDHVPPGFEIDESTLDKVVGDNEEILSYEVGGDKVTFFVSRLTELEFHYSVVPTLPGRLVSAPALMYPMYSPDDTAQSDSHRLSISPEDRDWGVKYVEEEANATEDTEDGGDDDEGGDDGEGDGNGTEGEDRDRPDISVDISKPDGAGDGSPEDTEEEDDTDGSGEDDGEDAGRSAGNAEGEVVPLIITIGGLLLIIGLLWVLKRAGNGRNEEE